MNDRLTQNWMTNTLFGDVAHEFNTHFTQISLIRAACDLFAAPCCRPQRRKLGPHTNGSRFRTRTARAFKAGSIAQPNLSKFGLDEKLLAANFFGSRAKSAIRVFHVDVHLIMLARRSDGHRKRQRGRGGDRRVWDSG